MLIDPFESPVRMGPTDFPKYFVNRKHPEDYILVPEPIVPKYIFHDNIRMYLHISWKTPKGYLPMTFMVDTTSPTAMSFCLEGMRALIDCDLTHVDEALGYTYVHVHYGGSEEDFFDVRMDFSQEKSVNFIGLRALKKLGLHVDEKGFRFDRSIPLF